MPPATPDFEHCGACVSGADTGADGQRSARRLAGALVITSGIFVVEVAGGIAFNSLALLADAAHMLTDVASLALALVAQRIALRPRTPERSYGFRRAETLAAFMNGIALGVAAIWIVIEAIERWNETPEVAGLGMLVVAVVGLIANLASAWLLSHGGQGHNLNTRAALFHVLSDAAGSVGAIVAAALVIGFGWQRADAAVSFLLAALILFGAWRLVRCAVGVLMEGAPSELSIEGLEATIRGTPGVRDVHDLHAWSISDGFPVVTMHIVVDASRDACAISADVCARLRDEHGIAHATVQPERDEPAGQAATAQRATTKTTT
jgi:cobalt-zinc-cadmium efflux system protein